MLIAISGNVLILVTLSCMIRNGFMRPNFSLFANWTKFSMSLKVVPQERKLKSLTKDWFWWFPMAIAKWDFRNWSLMSMATLCMLFISGLSLITIPMSWFLNWPWIKSNPIASCWLPQLPKELDSWSIGISKSMARMIGMAAVNKLFDVQWSWYELHRRLHLINFT